MAGLHRMSLRRQPRGVNSFKHQRTSYKKDGKYVHLFIKTHDGKPIWDLLKTYLNNLKVGEEFNRRDLLSCVYVPPLEIALAGGQTTVDQYRRYITINGFLSRMGWAQYKKLKNIPEHASIHKLKKHAYDSSWRSWYIKPEDL